MTIVFNKIGIPAPRVIVDSCEAEVINNKNRYTVRTKYVDLSDKDFGLIRKWILFANHDSKK